MLKEVCIKYDFTLYLVLAQKFANIVMIIIPLLKSLRLLIFRFLKLFSVRFFIKKIYNQFVFLNVFKGQHNMKWLHKKINVFVYNALKLKTCPLHSTFMVQHYLWLIIYIQWFYPNLMRLRTPKVQGLD